MRQYLLQDIRFQEVIIAIFFNKLINCYYAEMQEIVELLLSLQKALNLNFIEYSLAKFQHNIEFRSRNFLPIFKEHFDNNFHDWSQKEVQSSKVEYSREETLNQTINSLLVLKQHSYNQIPLPQSTMLGPKYPSCSSAIQTHANNFIRILIVILRLSAFGEDFLCCGSNSAYLLNLLGVHFSNQDLTGIKLRNTDLTKAQFVKSKLAYSIFSNVNISGCDFSHADLTQVDWSPIRSNEQIKINSRDPTNIFAVKLFQNGQILATASEGAILSLWNIRTGDKIKCVCKTKIPVLDLSVTSFSLTYNCQIGACGNYSKKIVIFSLPGCKVLRTFDHSESLACLLEFSKNHEILVSGSDDCNVRIWDVIRGQLLYLFEKHVDFVSAVTFAHNGLLFATGGFDQRIYIWKIWKNKQIKRLRKLQAHYTETLSLAFSFDDKWLASGGADQLVFVWSVEDGSKIRTLANSQGLVTALEFFPGSNILAAGSSLGVVSLWSTDDWSNFEVLKTQSGEISRLLYDQERKLLISCGSPGSVIFWEVCAACEPNPEQRKEFLNALVISRYGLYLACLRNQNTVVIWDLSQGDEKSSVYSGDSLKQVLAFSSNEQYFFSVDSQNVIFCHNIIDGIEKSRYCFRQNLEALATTADDVCLIAGFNYSSIQLLRIQDGQTLLTCLIPQCSMKQLSYLSEHRFEDLIVKLTKYQNLQKARTSIEYLRRPRRVSSDTDFEQFAERLEANQTYINFEHSVRTNAKLISLRGFNLA